MQAPPPHTLPWIPQFKHAEPAAPHASSASPMTHSPVLLQHPAQLSGPHPATQRPPMHAESLHSVHKLPPVPQAFASAPVRHCPSVVQHPSQLSGLHAGGSTHSPSSLHASPVAHSAHSTPPAPQAESSRPVWHSPSTKHPPHGCVDMSGIIRMLFGPRLFALLAFSPLAVSSLQPSAAEIINTSAIKKTFLNIQLTNRVLHQ